MAKQFVLFQRIGHREFLCSLYINGLVSKPNSTPLCWMFVSDKKVTGYLLILMSLILTNHIFNRFMVYRFE